DGALSAASCGGTRGRQIAAGFGQSPRGSRKARMIAVTPRAVSRRWRGSRRLGSAAQPRPSAVNTFDPKQIVNPTGNIVRNYMRQTSSTSGEANGYSNVY